MSVESIISGILQREGNRYTDRGSDRGGPTKFGITLATLSDWYKRPCSATDVMALTEAEARQIYEHQFIEQPNFDAINDEALREQLVDFGVNSGPRRAVEHLQALLGATVDGKLGPVTAQLCNSQDARSLGNRLAVDRTKYDVHLAVANLSQIVNLTGWTNRALSFVR